MTENMSNGAKSLFHEDESADEDGGMEPVLVFGPGDQGLYDNRKHRCLWHSLSHTDFLDSLSFSSSKRKASKFLKPGAIPSIFSFWPDRQVVLHLVIVIGEGQNVENLL